MCLRKGLSAERPFFCFEIIDAAPISEEYRAQESHMGSSIISNAAAGLQAQQIRLNVTASNTANLNSVVPLDPSQRTIGTPAEALSPTAQAVPGGGVTAGATFSTPPTVPRPDPGSTFANADGLVGAPNVNPVLTAQQVVSSVATYALNAELVQAGDLIARTTVSLRI